MTAELKRCLGSPVYWLGIGAGAAVRAVTAWYDLRWRPEGLWEAAGEFWTRTGSGALCFTVLAALIRLFHIDWETGAAPVILSTPRGRGRLLGTRLAAGLTAAALAAALLAGVNVAIALASAGSRTVPAAWAEPLAGAAVRAALGGMGLFLAAACTCDALRSHPAAMVLWGALFVQSYFINASALRPLEGMWFLRYGFFTELARGRALPGDGRLWRVWYGLVLGWPLTMAVRKRKENREL